MFKSSSTSSFSPTPEERVPRKAVPVAAFAFVAIVTMVEAAFWTTTDRLCGIPWLQPTADTGTVVAKRRLLADASGSVVLVGDSACMMGLIPSVVSEGCGAPVVNLGTLSSFTLAGFGALGAEALEAAPPPRALVIAVLPRSLTVSEDRAREFGLVGQYLVAYGRSSEQYRPDWRDYRSWLFFKHRFNVFPAEFGGSFERFAGMLTETKGWFAEPKVYSRPPEVEAQWEPDRFSTNCLLGLIEKAVRKGIPILLWWSPSPRDAVTEGYADAVERWAASFSASAPSLSFLQLRPPRWDPRLFGTVTHVNPEGARQNSQLLGQALAGRLRVSRRR